MSDNKILVLLAHPRFENSVVNKELFQAVRKVRNVEVHDLYQAYPEYWIDVSHEQKLLEKHDIIIFQHPLYWYSVPPLLKQWIDLVLEFNWAYGPKGDKLKDKWLISAVSSGGDAKAYSMEGRHGHEITDFLLPIKQTAKLCKMNYLPPFMSFGSHQITEDKLMDNAGLYALMASHLVSIDRQNADFSETKTMNEWTIKQLNKGIHEQ